MASSSPHLYRREGMKRGVPHHVLDRAISQMGRSDAHGSGPILSLNHLAHLSGGSHRYLRRIVQRRVDPYTDVVHKKRNGASRPISIPEPVLMDVQRVILRRALKSLSLHPRSFAYQRGRSIVDCARLHVGARYLLKFDLHDFFGGISEKRVYQVFLGRGYSKLVSLELARLCTRAPVDAGWYPRESADTRTAISSYLVGKQGRLPQGSPTSGALANAVATPLDHALSDLAESSALVYTRYSDDLVFSGSGPFHRREAASVVQEVAAIVSRNGFTLHGKKSRLIPPGARHVVLGLLVDENEVRLLPEFRRRVEVHIRGVRQFGLAHHVASRKFQSIFSFVDHVHGCLAFAKDVDPVWSAKMRSVWMDALAENGYPV